MIINTTNHGKVNIITIEELYNYAKENNLLKSKIVRAAAQGFKI